MRQRLTVSMQPVLVTEDDCAFGIVPRPGTGRVLDIVMNSKGEITPAIELRREGRPTTTIVFERGFSRPDLFFSVAVSRDFQEKALVWFEEGEPGACICLMISYAGEHLEHWVSSTSLETFIEYLNDYFYTGIPDLETVKEMEAELEDAFT